MSANKAEVSSVISAGPTRRRASPRCHAPRGHGLRRGRPSGLRAGGVLQVGAHGVSHQLGLRLVAPTRLVAQGPLEISGEIERRLLHISSAPYAIYGTLLPRVRLRNSPVGNDPARRRLRPLGEVLALADDVERTALHLVVDVADVLADHAEHDQLDAADERGD